MSAGTLTPAIRPVRIDGKEYYVGFIHDYQVTDMRDSTETGQWLDIQKAAMTGGEVEDNPIFDGSLGVYNGIILHSYFRVTTLAPASAFLVYDMAMSSLWTFIKSDGGKVTVTIIGILVSATLGTTFYILNRKRKSLVFEFISMARLMSVRGDMLGRVAVLVDGLPVQEVGLVQIRIVNSGTESIKVADYVRPVSFTLGPGAQLIEAEISEEKPAGIGAELIKDPKSATLKPTLLNSGDSLAIKLLIANFDGNIATDARLDGCQFREKNYLGSKTRRLTQVAAGMSKIYGINVGARFPDVEDYPNDYRTK